MLSMPENPKALLTENVILSLRAILFYQTRIEMIKPVHAKAWAKVFEKNKPVFPLLEGFESRKGEIVKSYDDLCFLPVSEIRKLSREAHQYMSEEGFNTSDYDYCPLLVSKNDLREAEGVLIDSLEEFTGIKKDQLLIVKNWNKYIDLNLHLLVPLCKDEGINLNALTANTMSKGFA